MIEQLRAEKDKLAMQLQQQQQHRQAATAQVQSMQQVLQQMEQQHRLMQAKMLGVAPSATSVNTAAGRWLWQVSPSLLHLLKAL